MAVAENRLSLMSRFISQSQIARVTGIPRSTVGFVIRGERTLPSRYIASTRQPFTRFAYTQMRTMKIPAAIARSRRYLGVDSIAQTFNMWEAKVDIMAQWNAEKVYQRAKDVGIVLNKQDLYTQYKQQVEDSLEKSRRGWDDIMNYGKTRE